MTTRSGFADRPRRCGRRRRSRRAFSAISSSIWAFGAGGILAQLLMNPSFYANHNVPPADSGRSARKWPHRRIGPPPAPEKQAHPGRLASAPAATGFGLLVLDDDC
ncbi:MAG: hypothetical protein R2856_10900 [Caldilineaceae bacterium]